MIKPFEVRFSDAPIGDMDVLIPIYVDTDGELVNFEWMEVNRFIDLYHLTLVSTVQQARGSYERPRYIGIFAGERIEYGNL